MNTGTKLSERDVCTKFITPALVAAGWDVQTQIREEVGFTKDRIIFRGRLVKEVREHWHIRKLRFTPAELMKWLGWICQNDMVPLGHPPHTIQQTTIEL